MNKILLSFNVLTIATSLSLYCVETKVGEEAKTDMVSTFEKIQISFTLVRKFFV